MKRTKTKILCLFLSVCMIVSCMIGLSVTASAQNYTSGSVPIFILHEGDTIASGVTITGYNGDFGPYLFVNGTKIGGMMGSQYVTTEALTVTSIQNDGYYLVTSTSGSTHTHTWSVTASGATATVKCTAADCPYTTDREYTITISADDKVYDGEPATATVTKSDGFPTEITAGDVYYRGRGSTTYVTDTTAPSDIGTYTALTVVTHGQYGDMISVDFDITDDTKSPNPATVTVTAIVIKGGNTVDLKDNIKLNGAMGDVSFEISGDTCGCSLDGSVLTSGDVTGTVTVNVTVAADENYEALDPTPITVTIIEKSEPVSPEPSTPSYKPSAPSIPSTPYVSESGESSSRLMHTEHPSPIEGKHIYAKPDSKGGINLEWDAVDDVTSYTVYLVENSRNKMLTVTEDTSYTFADAKDGVSYTFMVKYIINDELSKAADSYKITVTAGEGKPVVKATFKDGYIILTWKPVDGAEKYNVYRYENGKLRKLKTTTKTSVRIKAASGKEYKFAVKAHVNDKWTKVKKADIVTVTTE